MLQHHGPGLRKKTQLFDVNGHRSGWATPLGAMPHRGVSARHRRFAQVWLQQAVFFLKWRAWMLKLVLFLMHYFAAASVSVWVGLPHGRLEPKNKPPVSQPELAETVRIGSEFPSFCLASFLFAPFADSWTPKSASHTKQLGCACHPMLLP